jgi:general secretion pathway protein L
VDTLGNRIGRVQQGMPSGQTHGRTLMVLVPGEHVVLSRTTIPSRNTQKILQAAPFTLEDKLADDVATLHFAAGVREAGGNLIAVTAREHMRAWLKSLADVGLQPTALVPDYSALPPVADALVVALDAECALVRLPDGGGFSADHDLALHLIQRALKDQSEQVQVTNIILHIADADAGAAFASALADSGAEITQQPCNDGLLPLLAAGLRSRHGIDLLQGEFELHSNLQRHWRTWRMAASLAAVYVLLICVQQTIAYLHLKREAASLDAEVVALFNQAMPGSRLVAGREQAEMQALLTQLQGGGGTASPLPLLDALGNALAANGGVQIVALNYQDGKLQAQLQTADVAALDALKTALSQRDGFAVELDSVSASGNQVTGRLVLHESAS